MATVNIRRDVDDKFYRYKMPVLVTKIEGKGNGIKTVIPNMDEIAKALSRPPTYPTKFFGCELGAQTTMANERYIVNGAHQPDRLRELLDGFIEKFVLCPSCKNPETVLQILNPGGRNESIQRDCKACGARTDVDMRHKLTTYILKNPPAGAKGGKKVKKDKYAEAEAMRDAQIAGGNIAVLPTLAPSANLSASTELDAETPVPLPVSQLAASDDWAADTSPEAIAARMKNLEVNIDGFAGGLGDDDDDEGGDSPYALFGTWLEDNKATATDAEIVQKAKELEVFGKHKACVELGEKLWTDEVVAEVEKRIKCLAVMTTSEKHQKSLLGGFERFLGLPSNAALIPTLPKFLMTLYQADVLEEEVITSWGTHVSKKYVEKDISKRVRKAAEPLVKWLAEAEDDDDEDSD